MTSINDFNEFSKALKVGQQIAPTMDKNAKFWCNVHNDRFNSRELRRLRKRQERRARKQNRKLNLF